MSAQLLSLDYLYYAAPDLGAAVRFYTGALGGRGVWRIRQGGVTVAAVQLTETGPLARAGLRAEGEPFELPQGPCLVLRDPGQQRLAAYERVRHVDEHFAGRFDP